MKKVCIIFLLCCAAWAAADSDEEMFLRGNQLYNQEKYDDALSTYQRISKKNNAVWYNIGNCFYLLHDYNNAYAFWRKAALSCSTAQYKSVMTNIATAEQRLGKKRTVVDYLWYMIDGWQPLIVQLIFLFFRCILFWRVATWYKQGRKIALIAFILCMSVSALALGLKYCHMQQRRAIVVLEQAPVFIGPNSEYQQLELFEKGAEVKVIGRREQWIKIKSNRLKGWIAQDNVLEL